MRTPTFHTTLFGFLLALALTGCATSRSVPPTPSIPSAEEVAAAPIGRLPEKWQEQIHSFWQTRLFDPTEPVYEFGPPEKGYFIDRGETLFGWVVPYSLDSKTRTGGYSGPLNFAAFFANGRLRAILKAGSGSFFLVENL